MKKILMATGNLHKISEVKDILNSLNVEVEIVSPKQLDPNCDEPVVDGKTFKDNSYIKAKYYHDLFNLPTIADDSGICIDYYGINGYNCFFIFKRKKLLSKSRL